MGHRGGKSFIVGIFVPMFVLLDGWSRHSGRECESALLSGTLLPVAAALALHSCTLFSHSPYLTQEIQVPVFEDGCELVTSQHGHVQYQRWRVSPRDAEMGYVWPVGNDDVSKYNRIEVILYFHGTQTEGSYPINGLSCNPWNNGSDAEGKGSQTEHQDSERLRREICSCHNKQSKCLLNLSIAER